MDRKIVKTCTKCGLIKDRSEYHNDRSKKDGLGSCCKLCTKNRQYVTSIAPKTFSPFKTCTKCFILKPADEFGKDKYTVDGRMCKCKNCDKEWRDNNPDKLRNYALKREYGIDLNTYNKLRETQNYKCGICDRHESTFKVSLCVDHNHKTGKVRGLLCVLCNGILGKLKDDPASFFRAYEYLSKDT